MPTKDRDVIIACGNDRQFTAFCRVLEIPDVAEDERFRLNADRTANRDLLHPILVEKLSHWSADDLFHTLNAAGIPCGPINTIREGVELAQTLGLEPIVTVGADGDTVDLIANPITFSDAAPQYTRRPPRLGEHSDEIRAWLTDNA